MRALLPIRRAILLLLPLSFFFGVSLYAQTPSITLLKGLPEETTGSLLYGNGIYLASVIYPVRFYTSPDAVNWTSVTSPNFGASDSLWPALAYGAGIFVCVADSGKIFTSSDGSSWVRRSSPVTTNLKDVQFLQGAFYAVGDAAVLLHSADGTGWDQLTTGIGKAADVYSSIIYGNGYYVIAAIDPVIGKVFLHSSAGSLNNWTADTLAPTVRAMKFIRDRFYTFGDNVQISPDAVNWTDISHLNPSMVYLITGGFYDGSRVYLLANIDASGSEYGNGYVSTDDSTFTSVFQTPGRITDGLYLNNNYFVYGPDGIENSADAVNFETTGAEYQALASNGQGFIAIGNVNIYGYTYTSPDCKNWIKGSPFKYIDLYSIDNDGSRYLTAGTNGIYATTDGSTWNFIGPQIIRGESLPNFTSVAYGAGNYVGWGNEGLAYSTDAAIWQANNSFYPMDYAYERISRVKYVNAHFFAMGDTTIDGALAPWLLASPDGITWTGITPRLPFSVKSFNDIVYDGTKYYLMGTEGNINNRSTTGFFSESTANPYDPDSYGAKGIVTSPPDGSALSGTVFAWNGGHFAGGAVDSNNAGAGYFLSSTDGLHWDNIPLGVIGGGFVGVTAANDTFRLLGASNVRLIASFTGTPLPVTLISFDAVVFNNTTQLSWQTTMEQNSRQFILQRSTDNSQWDSIGVIATAGQSSTLQNYSFTDEKPQPGNDYYRLILINFDGSRQISAVKHVWIGQTAVVRVFPNPVKDNLTVELPSASTGIAIPGTAILYDASGHPVIRYDFSGNTFSLSTGRLASGIYELMIQQGDSQYRVQIIH